MTPKTPTNKGPPATEDMMQHTRPLPVFPLPRGPIAAKRLLLTGVALAVLSACTETVDFDLRDLANSFDTTAALAAAPNRPAPDDRGVISYPNYQVVVAERDDTARTIATRLGFNAEELAAYNGIDADVALRRDEIIALPSRVAEPSPATGAATTGPIQPAPVVDVTTLASNAIDAAEATPAASSGTEPVRHQVARGETAFSIARRYDVDVNAMAEWNGLDADLAVREGQFLLIPPPGTVATAPATQVAAPAPGTGSIAPIPPSAVEPLPDEVPPPATEVATAEPAEPEPEIAPDLGSEQSAPAASSAPMVRPLSGSIIREYSRGRNDGIDIAAPAGTQVRAAAAGTVAAITTDTAGIQIVVIRHPDNLLTVYTHVDNLTVTRNTAVSQGQVIGEVLAGDPSFVHFEVRRGTDSVDPAEFLP